MMRQTGTYEAQDGAKKMIGGLACEDCKPSEVHPHASCISVHTMLGKATVPCLVVARMEAVLEHCCLDVVSHPLVFGREGFYLPPQFGSCGILLGEVPPCPSLFFLPGYSPSPHRHVALVVLCLGIHRIYSFPGLLVDHGQLFAIKIEVEPCATLHPAGHKFHLLVPVMDMGPCKFPVVRTLIGSVRMAFLDLVTGDPLALGDVVLQEAAVSKGRRLNMDSGNQARLVLLSAGLGYVGNIALHRLAVLVAVCGVGIVGVLEAVRWDFLPGAYADNPVLDQKLLIEHAFEKRAVGHCLKDCMCILPKDLEPCLHGILIGAVDRLCRILCKITLNTGAQPRLKPAFICILDIFAYGLVNQNISRIECYVAADQLTVHAHTPARDPVCPYLTSRHLFEASPKQVHAGVLLIFHQSHTEIVICGCTRDIFLKTVKAKRPAGKEIELAFFKKLLVAASEPLLEKHHGHQPAHRRVRGSVGIVKQYRECALVDSAGHFFVEFILPCLWVLELLEGSLAKEVTRTVEQVHLRFFLGFAEHTVSCLNNMQI